LIYQYQLPLRLHGHLSTFTILTIAHPRLVMTVILSLPPAQSIYTVIPGTRNSNVF